MTKPSLKITDPFRDTATPIRIWLEAEKAKYRFMEFGREKAEKVFPMLYEKLQRDAPDMLDYMIECMERDKGTAARNLLGSGIGGRPYLGRKSLSSDVATNLNPDFKYIFGIFGVFACFVRKDIIQSNNPERDQRLRDAILLDAEGDLDQDHPDCAPE